MEKNLNRGFADQSLFEIGPVLHGKKPWRSDNCGVVLKKNTL